ncbi:unnamed protein product [Scytosiphon promiscuus]
MPPAARKRGRPAPAQEDGVKTAGCRRSTRIARTATAPACAAGRQPDAAPAAAPVAAPVVGRAAEGACEIFRLQDGTGRLRFWSSLLSDADQQRLFQELSLDPNLLPRASGGGGGGSGENEERGKIDAAAAEGGKWMQRPIKLFGKEILQPRLTCFYGQQGITYRYSGKTLEATPWDSVPAIQEILAAAEVAAEVPPGYFNCVLLNWYRDGSDYMGWHSDDEKELDQGAAIASVSLGTERRFQLRRKTDHAQQLEFLLSGGTLLLMEGSTQDHWQHRVPKRSAKECRMFREKATAAAAASARLSSAGQAKTDSGVLLGVGVSSGGGKGSIAGAGRRGRRMSSSAGVAAAEGKDGGGGGRINLTFRRVERGRCP